LLIKYFSANELVQLGGKKTVMPQDVMAALKDAELEEFLPRLEAELKSNPSLLHSHPQATQTSRRDH